ncbi:MAG: AAA family ATPase [Gaiellaceae bacterium]
MSGEPLVRKTVTVLFCDVVGSTSLGEVTDPETTRSVMLRYFDETRAVLEHHGATVEKFIGDAVMAVFGVPLLHEDDALRAVRAADDLRRALVRLNEELGERWGVQLEVRMGINTGEVVVGDPGSSQTIATGDTVNVAARLQQAAQPGQILIGRETHRLVRDDIDAGPLQSFSLKGRRDAVAPWQLEQVHERAAGMLRRIDSPFVGRRDERDALERAYADAVEQEECRLITVVGQAGLGKTRLAQEFAARLLAARVLQGRCLPYGDGITFWPVTEIVRQAAQIVAEDSPDAARAKIARLVGDADDAELVCARVWATIGLGESEARTEESFWALRRLFESLARERPLVLVFEDLHWAESTLLDLLEYLIGWIRGAPILLLCLSRPELLDATPSWAGGAISLEPLGEEDVRALAAAALGSGPLDPDIAEHVAAAADGNPLFAEELTRMLVEEGAVANIDGVWTPTGALDESPVPPTINALLAARLDRLEPDERTVIQCASVVGKEFWWGAVTHLAPPELRADVAQCLHALVRKKLVVPGRSAEIAGEDAFRFNHILVRDAAYAALSKTRRAELHARYADWLGDRAGDRATEIEEIIGYHYEQAYRTLDELGPVGAHARTIGARASALLGSAGQRAFNREDVRAAVRLLSRATSLPAADESTRLELLRQLSTALWASGEPDHARDVIDDVLAGALKLGDRRLEWNARLDEQRHRFDPDATAATATEAISVFETLGDDLGLASAWRRLAFVEGSRSRYGEAVRASEEALKYARRAQDAREEARCVDYLSWSLVLGPTPVPEALARCRELLTEVRDSRLGTASVSASLAVLVAMGGDFDEARSLYTRARAAYEEFGIRLALSGVAELAGGVELLAGDAAAAAREFQAGIAVARAMGTTHQLALLSGLLANALVELGQYDAARDALADAIAASEPHPSGEVARLVASARLASSAEEAVEQARRAVAVAAQTDSLVLQGDAHVALADALARANRAAEAAAAAAGAEAFYTAKGNTVAARRLAAAAQV